MTVTLLGTAKWLIADGNGFQFIVSIFLDLVLIDQIKGGVALCAGVQAALMEEQFQPPAARLPLSR